MAPRRPRWRSSGYRSSSLTTAGQADGATSETGSRNLAAYETLEWAESRRGDLAAYAVAAATGDLEVLAARSDWAEAHGALTVAHDAAMAKQWLHLGVTDRFDSYADWLAADCETRRRRVIAV